MGILNISVVKQIIHYYIFFNLDRKTCIFKINNAGPLNQSAVFTHTLTHSCSKGIERILSLNSTI